MVNEIMDIEEGEIFLEVRKIIGEFLRVDVEKIHAESDLLKDLSILGDDTDDLFRKLANRFQLDLGSIDLDNYFPTEREITSPFTSFRKLFGKREKDYPALSFADVARKLEIISRS